jgi:hypothetical protein
MELLKNKKGMLLLEFTIFFPLVIVAFFAFLLSALMITQRVVLDRAVANATNTAANWTSTSLHRVGQPNTFLGEGNITLSTNPYRGFINHFDPHNRNDFEERVKELVTTQAGVTITGGLAGPVEVTVIYRNYFVAADLTVNATQRMYFPINLSLIGINTRYIELQSTSSARVFRPLVNINDTHAVFDMIRYFTRGSADISNLSGFIGGLPDKADNWLQSIIRGFGAAGND